MRPPVSFFPIPLWPGETMPAVAASAAGPEGRPGRGLHPGSDDGPQLLPLPRPAASPHASREAPE